ncbi:MAG: hypothetical protein HY824_01955 [Acidobacteria bacterium]|nr:hypothetical protein [Acidobacteriota bacterium]
MISFLLAALTHHAACAGLPLTQGASWSYHAAVSWTPAGATAPRDSVFTWVTTVISAVRNDSVVVAAVRNWPMALAWWEPSRQPVRSLIVCRAGQVYHVAPPAGPADAYRDALLLGAATPDRADFVLELPLRVGALLGRDLTSRADALYAWTVESAAPVEPRLRALAATAAESSYTVARRTLSDHQLVDFVLGLGVTRYQYTHHGVESAVDAVLIAYRAP